MNRTDLLNQEFSAERPNEIWCVDFSNLYLKGVNVRYNCTIIDLHERSIISTVNGDHITTKLALPALFLAIKPKGIILHSDQGRPIYLQGICSFLSITFYSTEYMSRAGCPYHNAPIERYFKTLKHELI